MSYYNFYYIGDKDLFPNDYKEFSNKLFALSYLNKSNISRRLKWSFPFFEQSLQNENILIEPQETLLQLYYQRALYLRNSYDYLILFYSGGYDSHQILESFFLNNIFLDEVCVYTHSKNNFIQEKLLIVPDYYEPEKSAIPQARYLIQKYSPRTKLTIVDNLEDIYINYWKNFKKISEATIKCSSSGVLHKFSPRTKDLTLLNKQWIPILEKLKTGFIFGKEKVKLRFDNKGVFISIPDIDVIDHLDFNYKITDKKLENNIELFYVHPNFTKIYIKQAHQLLKTYSLDTLKLMFSKGDRANEDKISKTIYSLRYDRLYTGLKYANYKVRKEKQPGLDFSDMNLYYFISREKSDAAYNYKNYINFLNYNFMQGFDIELSTGINSKIKTIAWTKPYYIKIY